MAGSLFHIDVTQDLIALFPKHLLFLLRDLVYPGLDLHTRNRASLCCFWLTGARDVLDAGSGNGYFSWLAYRSGARVVAMNFSAKEVDKARKFLIEYRRGDPERLRFEKRNLYDLTTETRSFDEVICYETLEHIRRHGLVVKEFYRILRPGGVLHVCCPYRMHPRHQAEVLDLTEAGGHTRAGYTEDDYRELLESVGFKIDQLVGIGGKWLYMTDKVIRTIRNHLGGMAALPLLPLGLVFVRVARLNPPVPFSLYVRAIKPRTADLDQP